MAGKTKNVLSLHFTKILTIEKMTKTPIYMKSFRYRKGGTESNRQVLVTAQNQNTLKGFDITGLPDSQISDIQSNWNRYAARNMPLPKKESAVVSRVSAPFKTFSVSKIRYFHNN